MSNARLLDDPALWLKYAGLVTSSAKSSLTVDVGAGKVLGEIVLDVTALELTDGGEPPEYYGYDIWLQASPDALFDTPSNIVNVGCILSLQGAGLQYGTSLHNPVTGSYRVPFTNEFCGTVYRYLRLYIVVNAAAVPATGINFVARITKGHAT